MRRSQGRHHMVLITDFTVHGWVQIRKRPGAESRNALKHIAIAAQSPLDPFAKRQIEQPFHNVQSRNIKARFFPAQQTPCKHSRCDKTNESPELRGETNYEFWLRERV